MKRQLTIFAALVIGMFALCEAQDRPFDPRSYGVDETAKLIVLNIDGLDSLESSIRTIHLDKEYHLEEPISAWSNTETRVVSYDSLQYTLFFTKAPIISVEVRDSLVKFPKKPAMLHYYDADTTFSSTIGMSFRGNLSLTYPKKSFNVEFYEDSISKTKREIDFKDLRKDDDFILDGMYNEPLFIRSDFSQKLWKKIHTPYYSEQEPKARSTVDGFYVDLFVNKEYRGIYFLSEKVNRSLLKLKKKKEDSVRGELFKAAAYQPTTSFRSAPKFKNSLPMWGGFEMKYPYEDYTSHFDNLFEAIEFSVNSTPEAFANGLDRYYSIENLVDYFLFVNLIRATDNLGKNYYLARYNAKTPYFIVPWDMDGTLGTIQDGKRIPTTDDVLSHHLFDRLWNENPNAYRSKIIARWSTLRTGTFSNEKLHQRIEKRYQKLLENRCYERDAMIWDTQHEPEHLEYLQTWLQERLNYLDSYFKE